MKPRTRSSPMLLLVSRLLPSPETPGRLGQRHIPEERHFLNLQEKTPHVQATQTPGSHRNDERATSTQPSREKQHGYEHEPGKPPMWMQPSSEKQSDRGTRNPHNRPSDRGSTWH